MLELLRSGGSPSWADHLTVNTELPVKLTGVGWISHHCNLWIVQLLRWWHNASVRHVVHSLHVLSGEVCFPLLPSLSQCHVQRLASQHVAVHGSHCLGGLIGRTEAFKSLHELFVINRIVQIFHVQVDSDKIFGAFLLGMLELVSQLLVPLALLLRATDVDGLLANFGIVESFNSLLGIFVILH